MNKSQVSEILRSLGNTSDDVAKTLRCNGIRGRKCKEQECPLFNFLIGTFDNVMSVDHYCVRFSDNNVVPLTPACVEFIRKFDKGEYLDLVEEE